VSYNRPFTTRGAPTEDWLFNAEYPMLRWLGERRARAAPDPITSSLQPR
jgi:hypothetical protein